MFCYSKKVRPRGGSYKLEEENVFCYSRGGSYTFRIGELVVILRNYDLEVIAIHLE